MKVLECTQLANICKGIEAKIPNKHQLTNHLKLALSSWFDGHINVLFSVEEYFLICFVILVLAPYIYSKHNNITLEKTNTMTKNLKKNECNFCKSTNLGESTVCCPLPPPPLAPNYSPNIKKLHLIFSCACEHCILDYFCSLKLVYLKEIQTNMYELEHVKYICVEINMSQNMKNCEYISKLRLWILEFCSEFFRGE
jgi:hypothetical protein